MLVIVLVIFALLLLSTVASRGRLENRILDAIAGGTFTVTPGSAKIVQSLIAQGVLRDDGGVLTIDPERRAARVAAARGNAIRMVVVVISITGLVAVGTMVLLDRHTR